MRGATIKFPKRRGRTPPRWQKPYRPPPTMESLMESRDLLLKTVSRLDALIAAGPVQTNVVRLQPKNGTAA
jgi:hypothetical protein